jgi:hypothetical protein
MLVTPAFAVGQKQPPNPADYTVTVNVQSSRLIQQCTDVTNGNSVCVWTQQLTTLIDGKKYELSGRVKVPNLLRVGDIHVSHLSREDTSGYGALWRARIWLIRIVCCA